ncbi:MAG: fasciclin domain-containing protein [Oligoflexales bacterium]|nr:fasciclin domain-containing protein [Oligoflexales bacterium]
MLADKEALKNVLLFQVVGAKLSSQRVAGLNSITMLNGDEAMIDISDEGVFIENAQITAFDVKARNGIVHVIDQVILP